jgi:non-ribosomal peptide synthetase component F
MLPDNLGYIFDTALALTPSKAAVFQGETVLTYAELDARSNRMANALAGLGVTAGDRVALLFNNDFRFLETLFGTMRLGAVAVPLNIRMGDEALRYVAEDSEAVVLVANAPWPSAGGCSPHRSRRSSTHRRQRRRGRHAGLRPCWPAPAPLARRATAFDDVHAPTRRAPQQAEGRAADPRRAIWNSDIMRKALLADDTERASSRCRSTTRTRWWAR